MKRTNYIYRLIARSYSLSKVQLKEYIDSEEEVNQKVKEVASLLKSSKHAIAFIGAGMSTGSGVPDYRSGLETLVPTGPGTWEIQANPDSGYKIKKTNMMKIWPNKGHLALSSLIKEGLIKTCISQNVDGLLNRAHVPYLNSIELHGNMNKEKCVTCNKIFWRDYKNTSRHTTNKETGRYCDECHYSTINKSLIYFGDSLEKDYLKRAAKEFEIADYCLILGSSLQVVPAANLIRLLTKRSKQAAIINLQKTKMHKNLFPVHTFCENFLTKLNKELGIGLQEPIMTRVIRAVEKEGLLRLTAFDFEGKETDSFKTVTIETNSGDKKVLNLWPFEFSFDEFKQIKKIHLLFYFEVLKITLEKDQLDQIKDGMKINFDYSSFMKT